MGVVYTVPIENVTIGTAVQDIFSVLPGATHSVAIHHIHLEASVSAEAALRMRLKRGTATVTQGSGGTNVTPAPALSGTAAPAVPTIHINDTTQTTTTGAFTTLAGFQWDVALPFDHLPAPEDRESCQATEILILDTPATITSTVISGYIKVEVLG
jgi:hypothetical protein